MRKPKFSVIIPTLNEEKFLPKLLTSLVAQTQRDFEVMVVDGSSKDRTVSVAGTFRSKLPALTIEVSPKASLPLQRNLGARKARGEWLVFIDADSVLLPHFFERVAQFIAAEKPELFTTWFRPDSEVSGDAIVTLLANLSTESSIIFKRAHAPGPLAVVRRDVFEAVGGYDETLKWLEDYDFSRRVCERGHQMHVLRETLCVWSLRRFRQQGTLKVAQTYAKGVLQVLLRHTSKEMPGYIMGGHLYGASRRKQERKASLKKFEDKLKDLFRKLL